MTNKNKKSRFPLHTLIAFIVLAVALTGCGSNSNHSNGSAGSTGNTSSTNVTDTAAADTAKPKEKVELLNVSYDPTRELIRKLTINYSQIIGRRRTIKKSKLNNHMQDQARSPVPLSTV